MQTVETLNYLYLKIYLPMDNQSIDLLNNFIAKNLVIQHTYKYFIS